MAPFETEHPQLSKLKRRLAYLDGSNPKVADLVAKIELRIAAWMVYLEQIDKMNSNPVAENEDTTMPTRGDSVTEKKPIQALRTIKNIITQVPLPPGGRPRGLKKCSLIRRFSGLNAPCKVARERTKIKQREARSLSEDQGYRPSPLRKAMTLDEVESTVNVLEGACLVM